MSYAATILSDSLYIGYMAKLYMRPAINNVIHQLDEQSLALLNDFLNEIPLFSPLTGRTNYRIGTPMGHLGEMPIFGLQYGRQIGSNDEEVIFYTSDGTPPIRYAIPYGSLFNLALEVIANQYSVVFPWELTSMELASAFSSAVEGRDEFTDSGLTSEKMMSKNQQHLALSAMLALINEITQEKNGLPYDRIACYLFSTLGKFVGKQPSVQNCAKNLSFLTSPHAPNHQEIFGLFDILYYSLLDAPSNREGAISLERCPLCNKVIFKNGQNVRKYCSYPGNPADTKLTCSEAWTKLLRSKLYQKIKTLEEKIRDHNDTPARRTDLELFEFRDYAEAKSAIDNEFGKDKLRNMLARLFFLCYWSISKEALPTKDRYKKTPEGTSVDEIFDGISLSIRFQCAINGYIAKTESLKLPDATRFDTRIFSWLLNSIKTEETE